MRAVLTRDEMRAADAAALTQVSHETLVLRAGTAVAQPRPPHARRGLRPPGRGRRGQGLQRGRRSSGCGRLGPAWSPSGGHRGRRRAARLPRVRPGDRRRLRHRLSWFLRRTRVPAGSDVLAIDIPSGVDADSGEAGPGAVRADRTVTFAALKPGLIQGDGPAQSGVVEVADIGIGFPTPRAMVMEDADIVALAAPPGPRGQQMGQRSGHRRRLARHGGRRHPVHPRRHGGRGRA